MSWKPLPQIKAAAVEEFGRRFKKKARFLVDESAGSGLARALRERGWNAVAADEVGLRGYPDEDVFAHAWSEDRVILTHDEDFLDDRRFPFNRNPGVVVLPGASGEPGFVEAVRDVLAVIGRFREAYRGEKIRISSDQIWTVNGFDKKGGHHYSARYRFVGNEVYSWDNENEA
jgi:predicted nuclease of predicted toxin-antitoxin system